MTRSCSGSVTRFTQRTPPRHVLTTPAREGDDGESGGTGEWCKMEPISYKFVALFKPINIH